MPRGVNLPEGDELSASARQRPGGPTGRRPGNPDTRATVLTAARDAFAERGFDGASIRGIATAAGVDPALVHHYFGSKHSLFLAAISAPADPELILPQVLSAPRDVLGAAVVEAVLQLWDGPSRPALALVRSAASNERWAKLLRELMVARIIRRVVGTLDIPAKAREARGALVASQVIGLVMTRYVLELEPLALAPTATVVASVGPTVQRYLTGDVELPVVSPAQSAPSSHRISSP